MSQDEIRYPSVERIDPILIPRTMLVSYVVVAEAGGYFNTRQKAGIQQALEDALGPAASVRLKSERDRLSVYVVPRDSIRSPESFIVLNTLSALLRPKKPFVAAGYVMTNAGAPPGLYVLALRILGDVQPEAIQELCVKIQELPSVRQWTPGNEVSSFVIVVEGTWQRLVEDFMPELRQAGVSLCATPSTVGGWTWKRRM